jgi:hypothetical protein
MPHRMIDQIRHSQFPSNLMHAAARGALAAPPGEMLEILVHLALHNKVFGGEARMTLAGWDEKASQSVAADPATSREVLGYLVAPHNLRLALLPALLENPSVEDEELAEVAASGSRAVVETVLASQRVRKSPLLMDALRSNPRLRASEMEAITKPAEPVEVSEPAHSVGAAEVMEAATTPEAAGGREVGAASEAAEAPDAADEEVLAQALTRFLEENQAELAAACDQPFQPIGMVHAGAEAESAAGAESPAAAAGAEMGGAGHDGAKAAAAATTAAKPVKKAVPAHEERRDSTLQKIAKLDVKGRIHLAIRGAKEERSILIRDGTKLVALAVLDSPKVSDGEVEGFALQRNVLESVLRAIPLKRRFAKNYNIMRNLVFNPRTPLDLSLGLMKNLLLRDLKNLSGNKEVAETIRKLALRMFKQKMEKKD